MTWGLIGHGDVQELWTAINEAAKHPFVGQLIATNVLRADCNITLTIVNSRVIHYP